MASTRTRSKGILKLLCNPQHQSPLLRLPLELQSRIWSLLFDRRLYAIRSDPVLFTKLAKAGPVKWRVVTEEPPTSPSAVFQDDYLYCRPAHDSAPAVLRTCQLIYAATQPLFYSHTALRFQHNVYNYAGSTRLNNVGPTVSNQLQAFHRRYLSSSLSGLNPTDHLRKLDLVFTAEGDLMRTMTILNTFRWDLDILAVSTMRKSGSDDVFVAERKYFTLLRLLRGIDHLHFEWPLFYWTQLPRGKLQCAPVDLIGCHQGNFKVRDLALKRALNDLVSRPRNTTKQSNEEDRSLFMARVEAAVADELQKATGFGIDLAT